jgi:hypothetical protein
VGVVQVWNRRAVRGQLGVVQVWNRRAVKFVLEMCAQIALIVNINYVLLLMLFFLPSHSSQDHC